MPRSKSKREKAFELFNQGHGQSSEELKALKITNGTRRNYYSQWLNRDASGDDKGERLEEAKPKKPPEKKAVEKITAMPIDEVKKKPEVEKAADSTQQVTPEEEEPSDQTNEVDTLLDEIDEGDKKEAPAKEPPKVPKSVPEVLSSMSSEGVPIRIMVSIKTLTLYEIARATARAESELNGDDGDLSMGDFVDLAVEDFFEGRGYELGLIDIKQEEVPSGR